MGNGWLLPLFWPPGSGQEGVHTLLAGCAAALQTGPLWLRPACPHLPPALCWQKAPPAALPVWWRGRLRTPSWRLTTTITGPLHLHWSFSHPYFPSISFPTLPSLLGVAQVLPVLLLKTSLGVSIVLSFLFIYLFLAVLGLHCCIWASPSCDDWGLLFVAVHGLLIVVASLVIEHGLYMLGLQ